MGRLWAREVFVKYWKVRVMVVNNSVVDRYEK